MECGAANYIDRALAGALAAEKGSFLEGLAGVDTLARSTHNAVFAELSPEVRDELLNTMDNGTAAGFPNARPFFNRVRRLTLEGMFSDPYYGGNKNFAGWDLIRYPGPRLAVAPEDQKMSYASEALSPIRLCDRNEIMAVNLKAVDVAVIGWARRAAWPYCLSRGRG